MKLCLLLIYLRLRGVQDKLTHWLINSLMPNNSRIRQLANSLTRQFTNSQTRQFTNSLSPIRQLTNSPIHKLTLDNSPTH